MTEQFSLSSPVLESQGVRVPPDVRFSRGATRLVERAMRAEVPPAIVEVVLWDATMAGLGNRGLGRKVGPFGPGREAFDTLAEQTKIAQRNAIVSTFPRKLAE